MNFFEDYNYKYPNLIMEILKYFEFSDSVNGKSVQKFCEKYGENTGKQIKYIYNPIVIDKICKKLCDNNIMSAITTMDALGMKNNYCYVKRNKNFWENNRKQIDIYCNSKVYGFEYIYEIYKDIVVPLVWEKDNGDYSMATGFKFRGGIVTARHCIEDVNNLKIKGFTTEELSSSKIYVHLNSMLDIAYIDVGKNEDINVFIDEGKIMQDVLTLGYPKLPMFNSFLTAEKATISSKAQSRLLPTKGSIASYGEYYMAHVDLMLITAKIKGGNSGGPVINDEGSIVGVACQKPFYNGKNGDYDDLGYGIVVPIKYVEEMICGQKMNVEKDKEFFREFE